MFRRINRSPIVYYSHCCRLHATQRSGIAQYSIGIRFQMIFIIFFEKKGRSDQHSGESPTAKYRQNKHKLLYLIIFFKIGEKQKTTEGDAKVVHLSKKHHNATDTHHLCNIFATPHPKIGASCEQSYKSYRFILRYRVLRSMPRIFAALLLLPPVALKASSICVSSLLKFSYCGRSFGDAAFVW